MTRIFIALAALGLTLGLGDAARAADASALYDRHCASCHGKDGKAGTAMGRKLGVKDLTQSKTADAEIQTSIKDGYKDKQGKLKMPGFKEKLSADEITALLNHVKALRP
jgi:mono/diheme cytochrome c family protein